MGVERFREDILRFLQQEGCTLRDAKGAEPLQDATIQRVAKEVFEKVVGDIFPKTFILPRISSTPSSAVVEIYNKCLRIQKGESSASLLVEIAKLCAQQNGGVTAENIKNFGITDQAALVEIAKLCARQNGWGTAKNILNFGITDQNALVEIAKLCARQDGRATADHIQNFGITDQNAKVEIAKLCAQQDGWGTALYIRNFGITDQAFLVEIAKLCAQQGGEGTALYIRNFGITDQNALVEIAKLCAQQNGGETARYIKNFGITNQAVLIEIGVYCVLNSTNYHKNKLEDPDYFKGFPAEASEKLEVFYNTAQDARFIESIQQELGVAWKFITDYVGIAINKEMFVSLFFACKALDKIDVMKSNRIPELMEALLAFRVPSLKPLVLQSLLELIIHDEFSQFNEFIKDVKIPTKAQNKSLALVFILTIFSMQHLDEDLKKSLVKDFLKTLGTRSSFLAQASKTRALIESIRLLNDKISGGKEEVCAQFLSYTSSSDFSRKLFIFQAAVGLNIDIVGKTFEEVTTLVHQQIAFPVGFEEIYATLRRPESLVVYLSRINTLPDSDKAQVKATLTTYMQEVANGTFTENRYAQSPQLLNMQKLYGEEKWRSLIAEWKQNRSRKIEEFSPGELPAQQTVEVRAFFEQKRTDGHFPEDKMPLLSAVLAGTAEVKTQIEKLPQSTDKSTPVQKFDALCARLALTDPLDRQLVQQALDSAPREWEIRNDLLGLLEQMKNPLDDFKGYSVENTDNHWDLFLCGTEVAGSCQRVDGDPQLNKNLLGYVVDGKVRMIAVKDTDGRIVARSIIKLLWDGVEKKPVLLMERVYSNNATLDPVVEQMAKQEAVRLGVELVTAESARDRRFQSFPNRSGFEYEDAAELIESVQGS